ncbi:hypothetical protein, conserved [Plasmodium gonderi]|uniref:SprT-like domain-containing protein n=1 Tax=Plasmodium gonderi TaxID=77519 RepID=A0A1Y1JL51_PLAGO|nr:hypothetical protein, conserved [Plasmodium gonderi]GAW82185.1 hypothetical protein, conserved [Plasmodium gonderi]
MNDGINKLTSVESEYLEKSGKKRRQKISISYDDISMHCEVAPEQNGESIVLEAMNSNKDFIYKNENVNSNKKGEIENSTCVDNSEEDHANREIEEEDYETMEVIKQLSSIHIESDTDDSVGGDKVAYNKKDNSPKKRNRKKRGKNKITHFYDNSDVECVEDAVVYDESKDTEFPDLQELFTEYNEKYFFNKLQTVQVKWSNKMKLCAGICVFKKSGYCCIRLSLPLLKLRKIKEYRETLLHEMIHAFLFLTRSNARHDGHGPEFKKNMYRINKATGLCITIYHSFHKEVNFYRNHVWRCTGVCRTHAPHFGYVKRSMNRPPGPKEKWWRRHSSYCRGNFVKIDQVESSKNVELVDFNSTEKHSNALGKALDSISVKNKKTRAKDNFEKRVDNVEEEIMNDAIVILDSKEHTFEKQKEVDEMDIINLIKNLFSDNKNKVWSFPDISVDYQKAFKSENYFEID